MSTSKHFANITATSERPKQQRYADFVAAQRSDDPAGVVKPTQNRLLEALPKNVQARLLPCLQLVFLPPGKIIHECGRHPLSQIIFPVDSIASLQCMAKTGSCVEVAMVGNEGLVGIAALLGSESHAVRAQVWRAGHAYLLPAQRLGMEFDNSGELRTLLLRYTQSLFDDMAQTAYCNRRHSISQQFCRWLLLCLDRLPGNQLNMTQEMIANTLGVRVASISEVACKLQKRRVIEYHRGKIAVLNRRKLERIACNCYATVRNRANTLKDSLRPMNRAD